MTDWRQRTASGIDKRTDPRCKEEQQAHAELDADVKAGTAVPASQDSSLGPPLVTMLHELLQHPLCGNLPQPPKIYIHHDFNARMSTFGNVIIVPYGYLAGDQLSDPQYRTALKAAMAHEVAHIISDDFRQLARNPLMGTTTGMEDRADLIAAHLCADGGRALADWLDRQRKLEEFASEAFPDQAAGPHVEKQKDRYTDIDKRITRLREWSDAFARGEPLPTATLASLPARRGDESIRR